VFGCGIAAAARSHRRSGTAVVVLRHANRVRIRRRQKGSRGGQEGRNEGDGGQPGSETGHDSWFSSIACANRSGRETTENQPNRFMSGVISARCRISRRAGPAPWTLL
jgi:hypothetical protein